MRRRIEVGVRTLFILVVAIALLHFILTSLIGHYIAVQVGRQTGQIIAQGLIESSENPSSSEKEIHDRYQDMKSGSDEAISRWRLPLLLISLPIKPVIQPLLNKIRRNWIYEPALSKTISKDQVKHRGIIIDNVVTALNSLTFGLLIYLACRLILKGSAIPSSPSRRTP